MGFNAKWFKQRIEDLGLSQRQFAKRVKLDPSSITLLIQGKRKLKTEEAALMSRLFGVELSEVLENAGIKVGEGRKAPQVAVTGTAGDGLLIVWASRKTAVKGAERFPSGTEAVRLETAGTLWDGLDGAIAFYRPRPGVNAEAVGRLSVVTVKDGRSMIRVLRRGYSNGRFNLASVNGEIIERDIELISAWPVINLRL